MILDCFNFSFFQGRHVDPSLAEKYRMLEKAILVDQLNSKISHRPGPLELIEKNILHTNEPIEKIVKEGLLPFKVGSEDELVDKNFLSFEDDSQSSEGDLFQANLSHMHPEIVLKEEQEDKRTNEVQGNHIFEALPSSSTGNIINISLVPSSSNLLASSSTPISVGTFKILNTTGDKNEISTTINIPKPPPPPKLELITYHVKPVNVKGLMNTQNFLPIQITETPINSTILSTPNLLPVQTQTQNTVNQQVNQHVSSFIQNNQNQKYSAPGKDKNRKKCKNKAVSKRAIKFHEYKGPTNKNSSSTVTAASANCKKVGETNFDLIMQQQCLLEYLENIYKNPHAKSETESLKHPTKQLKIESNSDVSAEDLPEKSSKLFNKPHVTIFPSKPQSSLSNNTEFSKDSCVSDVGKLAKMKVSELKAYLKRINLPVSGPKPLLIERLKPYLPLKPLESNDDCSEASVSMSDCNDFYNSSLHSVSSTDSDMDGSMDAQFSLVSSSSKDEDIVAEQQRKIEELQRKLQQSQQELEQIKQHKIVEPFQMPAVFVVDVQSTTDEHSGKSKTPMLLNAASSQLSNNDVKITPEILSPKEDNEITSSNQIDKEAPLSNPPLPMSQEQDISDVLEILLKNGEWPEISDGNFNQNSNESDNFIENVLSGQVNVMSPMLQEESIDKILGRFWIFVLSVFFTSSFLDTVTPSDNLHSTAFSSSFNGETNIEFPMDVDDSMLLSNTDFNRNFGPSEFVVEKSAENIMQSYDFNSLKMENCDTKYNQYLKGVKNNQEESKPLKNRNGLIANFDHNVLFDSLKNNNINNNNNSSELFLIPQDSKFSKDDSKSLHLTHNFDTLYTGLDHQMDFESIIPYSTESHDPLFQNTSLFNLPDEGMMNCEDLNF